MKNRKNILTVTVIVLVGMVLLVIGAYFVTKGASEDIEPTVTPTPESIVTPTPKPTLTPEETIAPTPELKSATEESDLENEDESATESIIDGEISFNGVDMSQFFSEPIDALGPPLSIGEDNLELFYKDFSVVGDHYVDDPENVVYMIKIPDSNMVEINGISMNKQRDELVSLFGNPVSVMEGEVEGDGEAVSYYVETPTEEKYQVSFIFVNSGSNEAPQILIGDALYGVSGN
jgi:hypothetical protein